jgi:hypothetical protein
VLPAATRGARVLNQVGSLTPESLPDCGFVLASNPGVIGTRLEQTSGPAFFFKPASPMNQISFIDCEPDLHLHHAKNLNQ